MSKQYYDSSLTGAEIDKALKAVSDLVTQNNNGKILTIENGKFAAKKPSEIAGTAVLETLNVSANGDYYPESGVDGFDEVHVTVPSYPEPTGTIQIASNGTVNVKDYASAEVSVPSGITAADEGKVVKNGVLVAQTARSATITENGTYDTTENNSVIVNVSGGGGSINWRDQLVANWDFSNPVNTRGNTSYTGSGSWISSINGWGVMYASIELVNGGVKLTRNGAGASWSNQGYLEQRYRSTMTSAMVGKQVTLSAIIDGVLGYKTETLTSGAGDKLSMTVNGVGVRLYNYGTEIAITFDIGETSHIIQAVKLEAGNQQTLATQVNGVWVLNNSMDADTEYIKAKNGTLYYS